MERASNQATTPSNIGRRSPLSKAVVCTTCLTLFMIAVVAVIGKASQPVHKQVQIRSKLHRKNAFFNAALAAAPPAGTVTVDQVVSLREVPVPEPMAVVWNPAPTAAGGQGPIPGPAVALNFQPLSAEIVKDPTALIALGKALFWDMQVGSDGIQSCATCHFSAGADIRNRNQISPNLSDANFKHNAAGPPSSGSGQNGDALFGNSTVPFTANDPNSPSPSEPPDPNLNRPGHPTFAPNYKVTANDFPLNDWFSPTELTPRGPGVSLFEEMSNVSRDTNDILASQGVRLEKFLSITPGSAFDNGSPVADSVFNMGGLQVRRAMPRNSPTMINAVFNFDNLWEGRASFIFNGVNNAGFRDRTNKLQLHVGNGLTPVFVRITNSSLASVSVGPPLSNIAMSYSGRTMPDVGLKMVNLRPLARQLVHPHDSTLGSLSRATLSAAGTPTGARGLKVRSYCEMIQAAFQNQWWDFQPLLVAAPIHASARSAAAIDAEDSHSSSASLPEFAVSKAIPTAAAASTQCQGSAFLGPGSYTQMQANFSLFFGLAVQAYMATLVSDNTPLDQFNGAPNPVRQPDGSPCPTTGCVPIPPDPTALTAQQSAGLTVFLDDNANLGTHCADCHIPPVTTGHTVLDYQPDDQGVPSLAMGEAIEFMIMGDNLETANYDHGMYNIGLRRSSCGEVTCGAEDKGRGANAAGNPPFQNPLIATTVNISSISRASNLVTVTTASPIPTLFTAGQPVTIAQVTDPSFDGTFSLGAVLSTTQFTYAQTAANASSSAGFAATLAISSISRDATNLVTVTTATPLPSFFAPGLFVRIAGVADPTFNSTFVNGTAAIGPQGIGVKLSANQFTYKVPGGLLGAASSTGGTVGAGKPFPDSLVELTALREDPSCGIPSAAGGCLPPDVARFIPDVPILPRRVTNGAFKAPNLRNIKYSGPYFHVGDSATLRQVVEFYTRGGNFPNTNLHDKTVDVDGIPPLMFPEFDPVAAQFVESLVEFLANGLTDHRVAFEQGPFDHPQLYVPNGSPALHPDRDVFIVVPAVGTEGRATELPTFLNLDPQFEGPP
jgi:cytochrome c peroxidase